MWRLFLYPLGGPLDVIFGALGLRSEFLGGQPTEAFAWVIVRPDLGQHGHHDGHLPGRSPDHPA